MLLHSPLLQHSLLSTQGSVDQDWGETSASEVLACKHKLLSSVARTHVSKLNLWEHHVLSVEGRGRERWILEALYPARLAVLGLLLL